jgi:prepilin-type N-terminal cleavage/methylation domain-containing protein
MMRNKGFSLLEILVAMMILVIGLASVFGLFGMGARSYRRSVNDINVSQMAQTIFSGLENDPNPSLQDATDQVHSKYPAMYKYDIMFQEIPDLPDRTILVIIWIKINDGKGGEEEFQMLLKPKTRTP